MATNPFLREGKRGTEETQVNNFNYFFSNLNSEKITMIEDFLKARISFIEEVITQDGYNGADKALWELYGELKLKLKEESKIPVPPVSTVTIKLKDPIQLKGDPTKLTDEDKAKIKKLVQEGDKPSAISRKVGIPAQRLYYWVDKIKTELRIQEKENAKSSEQESK